MVPLNPGDLVIWAGDIAHAGSAYARSNMRFFAYFPTEANPPDNSLTNVTYVNTKKDKYIITG